MDDIEFNDEQSNQRFLYTKMIKNNQSPRIVNFLIKKGIVKTDKSANVLIICIVIILLVLSAFISSYSARTNVTPTVEDVIKSVTNK